MEESYIALLKIISTWSLPPICLPCGSHDDCSSPGLDLWEQKNVSDVVDVTELYVLA